VTAVPSNLSYLVFFLLGGGWVVLCVGWWFEDSQSLDL
jgi:hypothetical protein